MEIQFLNFEPTHLEAIVQYRQDPVTCRFNPLAQLGQEELNGRLTMASAEWTRFETADSFFWSVSDGENLVGTASIQNINRMMMTAEIGYGVFAGFRGQGIATQIVGKLTEDCFRNSALRKLFALVHEDNVASRKVLEANRYQKEGVLREHYVINGLPANEVMYGILRREIVL